jgi:hypothetical protein
MTSPSTLLFTALFAACGGPSTPEPTMPDSPTETAPDAPAAPAEHAGPIDRAEIIAAEPRFDPSNGAEPAAEAIAALASVTPGAEITIVLGLWCGDSRRELSRFFRALDAMGSEPPFSIRYIAVDRAKEAPGGAIDGLDIRYVPTFIVRRDGAELGRVVESAPRGLETELASLLRGETSGVVSNRTDL